MRIVLQPRTWRVGARSPNDDVQSNRIQPSSPTVSKEGLHTIIFVSWRRAADYKDNEVYKLKLIFLYGNIAIIFEMIVRRRPVDAVH